jgi:hypothetical protein
VRVARRSYIIRDSGAPAQETGLDKTFNLLAFYLKVRSYSRFSERRAEWKLRRKGLGKKG